MKDNRSDKVIEICDKHSLYCLGCPLITPCNPQDGDTRVISDKRMNKAAEELKC